MQERAEDAAFDTAFRISVDTGDSAAEEVRYNTRKNQSYRSDCRIKYGQEYQTYDTAYEGDQETDQDRIRCVRENNRAVDRRYSARNEFLCNTSEGRDNLTDNETNTAQNDIYAAGEAETACDCPYSPVCPCLCAQIEERSDIRIRSEQRFRILDQDALGYGDSCHDQEEDDHCDTDGNCCVAKEGKSLREIDVFCGVVFIFCKYLCNCTAEPVADSAEVSEGKFIRLDDLLHRRCAVSRRSCRDESKEHSAAEIERESCKAADLAENCDHRCHVQCVMTCQEDVFHS